MLRLSLLAVTAIAVFTAAAHWWMDRAQPAVVVTDEKQVAVENVPETVFDPLDATEVKERIENRRQFAAYADALVVQLARGAVSLRQARDRIVYYCLGHYPDYLNHVQVIERGGTLNAKLARCLARFVCDYQRQGEEIDTTILGRIEAELAEIEREEETQAAAVN